MSGMGVVRYCTSEGGSGYITNPALPWLSSYNITHDAPVYDQETAWMRESRPGSFTNYSRFGAPYSADGGVLPPYREPTAHDEPSPVQVGGCGGMGGLGDDFDSTCLQIQCGAISQSQAGMDTIMACARAGHVGVRSCFDPACAPWCAKHPSTAGSPVLLRSDVVAPMPSITSTAREGCEKVVQSGCGGLAGVADWIESNPWLAAGLAVVGGYLLFGGGRR
jgi:hypothetical protein